MKPIKLWEGYALPPPNLLAVKSTKTNKTNPLKIRQGCLNPLPGKPFRPPYIPGHFRYYLHESKCKRECKSISALASRYDSALLGAILTFPEMFAIR